MTKEEFLSFKFHQEVPKYGDKLLKRLDEFRKKNLYFDVKLKTLDEELVAHKVVLAACGGVFRRNFVDPTTMMIIGDVTMVEFHCPSAGILPILRFAYSGRLELSAEDLIPVFVAADVTEMHEVSDICAGVCTEKLGWILDFDGTDQQDLDVLEKILRLNLKHFENYNHKGEGEFPGLGKVIDLWPELVEIYQTVVGCVRKAVGMVGEGVKEDSMSKDSKAGSENVEGTAKLTEDSNKTDADEVKSCGTDVSAGNPANDVAPSGGGENVVFEQTGEKKVDSQSREIPRERPKLKPRSISLAEPETKEIRRESSKSFAHPGQSGLPVQPGQPVQHGHPGHPGQPAHPVHPVQPGQSPKVTKRKPAAPKPPSEPTKPKEPQQNAPESPKYIETPKKPTQPPIRPPKAKSSPKVPPPRPKPPSVKKKVTEPRAKVYDETLNPFALDEEEISKNGNSSEVQES